LIPRRLKRSAWLVASLVLAVSAVAEGGQAGRDTDEVIVVTGTRSGEGATETILPVTRIDGDALI